MTKLRRMQLPRICRVSAAARSAIFALLRPLAGWMMGACMIALGFVTPAQAMQQAFLIQNSGWMAPHYSDKAARFKPLVAEVIRAMAAADDEVSIYAFNHDFGDSRSPDLRWEGRGAGEPAGVVGAIAVAEKHRASHALADTDLIEAVTRVIDSRFKRQPGVLWVFTNNYNSPGNDPDTVKRNRDFYDLLHMHAAVSRTVAYAVAAPARGRADANEPAAMGFMLYGLAYGDTAARHLVAQVDKGKLAQLLNSPAALLKPLDVDPVRVLPTKAVLATRGVGVSQAMDTRCAKIPEPRWVIRLDQHSAAQPRIAFDVDIANRLYPHDIRRASMRVEHVVTLDGRRLPAALQPEALLNLPPDGVSRVRITLPLEPVTWTTNWNDLLTKMGDVLPQCTVLRFTLADQQLEPSAAFAARLRALFPRSGDDLLEVFRPPPQTRPSVVEIKLRIDREYPWGPLALAIGGLLLLLSLLLLGGIWMARDKRYAVRVDGLQRSVAVKPWRTAEMRNAEGLVAGKLYRGFRGLQVVDVVKGHTLAVIQ